MTVATDVERLELSFAKLSGSIDALSAKVDHLANRLTVLEVRSEPMLSGMRDGVKAILLVLLGAVLTYVLKDGRP